MSRYADVDALLQSIRRRLGIASLDNLLESEKAIVKEIGSAPSINICFCRECKAYDSECEWCGGLGLEMKPDDFCSYGQKGDENVETD